VLEFLIYANKPYTKSIKLLTTQRKLKGLEAQHWLMIMVLATPVKITIK